MMPENQINLEAEYKSLKTQYDSLLEKNQNDLIKIKQKEKQLNEQISKLKEERASKEAETIKRVKTLQEQMERERNRPLKEELIVDVNSRNAERTQQLEIDMRRLMDSNIALTAENTAFKHKLERATQAREDLAQQINRLKDCINSIESESRQLRIELTKKETYDKNVQSDFISPNTKEITVLQLQLSHIKRQLQHSSSSNHELRQQLKHSQQQGRVLSDRQRKSMQLLKKRQQQLSAVQGEVDKLKAASFGKKRKTETNESICLKCKQLEQEIHLLKQMVKSTKGMVRVREIQAEKYRLHDDPSIKDNRSVGKLAEKPSTLPPLRKNRENEDK